MQSPGWMWFSLSTIWRGAPVLEEWMVSDRRVALEISQAAQRRLLQDVLGML
jgi:hypothetical protein